MTKKAVSKLHLLLRRLSPEARASLATRLGLPDELAARVMSARRGGTPLKEVLSRPSRAVPSALAEGLLERSGFERLDSRIASPLLAHLEKHYPGLNVTRELGHGLESGAVAVAPSAFTRRVTRETGPVVLKYGVTNPLHRAAIRLAREKHLPPTWRVRSFAAEGFRGSGGAPRVYSWLEPLLKPARGPLPERLMENRIRRLGLHAHDIERGRFDPAQLGYRLGSQNRLLPIDRGVVSETGLPVFHSLLHKPK